jgi:hypothetical protein
VTRTTKPKKFVIAGALVGVGAMLATLSGCADDAEVVSENLSKAADNFEVNRRIVSDNVSYFVEQGQPIKASANHYRVTFKPQSIIPDPDFRGSMEDIPRGQR